MTVSSRNWPRRQVLWVAVGLVATALAATGCGGDDDDGGGAAAGGEGPDKVTLMLPYRDSIVFPGLEIARHRYFEEEGLEVETVPTDGSTFVLQQLISGQQEFGIADAANLMIAASKGADLRAVWMVDRDVFTIVAPADSDVSAMEDLDGKKLGFTEAGGGEEPLVKASIADAGLTAGENVELVPVGGGGPTSYSAIKNGKVDAYAGGYNDLAVLEQEGLAFKEIVQEQYRDLPAGNLIVTADVLNDPEKRDIAVRLGRAWYKGVVFAQENPESALEIICGLVPEDCEDREGAKSLLDKVLVLLEKQDGQGWGQLNPEAWTTVQDTMLSLDKPVEIDSVMTNELNAEVNDFDEEAVRAEASSATSQ